MTMRRTKRYTVQSFKKKEETGDDPYEMTRAPRGLLECPDCSAIYHRKRWVFPSLVTVRKSQKAKEPKRAGKAVMVPQPYLCPACRKIRDGYAEGFIAINWPNWVAHKADVLNLIHNEEKRACKVNPLERVMAIRERPGGVDIETTTEHLAQRLGNHLNRAFRGQIQYKWSHKDKLGRVEWKGPIKQTKARRT